MCLQREHPNNWRSEGCLTGIAAEKEDKWWHGLFPLNTYSLNSSLTGSRSCDCKEAFIIEPNTNKYSTHTLTHTLCSQMLGHPLIHLCANVIELLCKFKNIRTLPHTQLLWVKLRMHDVRGTINHQPIRGKVLAF